MREDVGQRQSYADNGVAAEVLTFRGWTLEFGGRTLTDPSGRDVHLTPSEFKLLATLARRPGSVLSRDQLLDAVAGRASAPFDRAIDVLVGRLRKKIEADRKSPRIIVTVPGFGYKLIAEAQRAPAFIGPPSSTRVDFRAAAAVAILPFAVGEPDSAGEAVAARLTESLTADLAFRLSQSVISGSVWSRQILREYGLRRLGDDLGARYVVSGSVHRIGFALRISAYLAETVSARHLWTERATIGRDELGAAEDSAATRIALALSRQLTIAEGTRAELAAEKDIAALLARGKAMAEQAPSRETSHAARRFFERALAIDGDSVEATIRLGRNLPKAIHNRWSTAPASDEARADDLLARARLSSPRDTVALLGTASLFRLQGCLDETIAVLRCALEVDPAHPEILRQLGFALMYRGRPGEGLRWIEKSIDFDPTRPDFEVGLWGIGACHQVMGHASEGFDWLLRARASNPGRASIRIRLASAFGQIGEIEEAQRELRAAQESGYFTTLTALAAERQARHPDYRAKAEPTYYAGLRRAGMAER